MNILVTGGLGYIGSQVYWYLTERGHDVTSVDLNLFPDSQPLRYDNRKFNYADLRPEHIASYDVVIHLAGHSSVPACKADPSGSLVNNCFDFFRLVGKLNKTQKFIYASSGSVYGTSNLYSMEHDPLEAPLQEYDRQKQLCDGFMSGSALQWYGLRFGTVCGYSSAPRNELMINCMVRNALINKTVTVVNGNNTRAILGMRDLCRAVESVATSPLASGYYNLASFNSGIDPLGKAVAARYGASFTSTATNEAISYSFMLDTSKFRACANFEFRDTLNDIMAGASLNDHTVQRCPIQI